MESQGYTILARAVSSLGLSVLVGILLCGVHTLPCSAAGTLQGTPGTTATQPPASPRVDLPSYRVNPGDTLDISVFDKPELSQQVLIPPDGKIQYAFVEEFVAAQLTLKEIKDRLTASLSKQLNNPQVSVALIKRQVFEVSVLGAVKSPGKRQLGDKWRVLDLIADSGGLIIARPEWVTATLVRGGGAEAIPVDLAKLMNSGSPEHNPVLSAGDVLLIREVDQSRISLQVIGEVAKPGFVILPQDGSFATIITAVGGFNPRASRAKVTLLREGQKLNVDMREILTTGKALGPNGVEIKAQPGDTIIVAENKLTYAVLGAVNRAGVMEFPESGQVTLLSALTLAGGPHPAADLKNAVLVHLTPGGQPKGEAINLEDLMKKDNLLKNQATNGKNNNGKPTTGKERTMDIVLQPGDYIFVPAQTPGRPNTFLSALGNALTFLPLFNLFSQ